MERARKWFHGEEPEKVEKSKHWFVDSVIDGSKLDITTPIHKDPEQHSDRNSNKEYTTMSPSKSFSTFNFHKRVSTIKSRKKKTQPSLKSDFLSVVNSASLYYLENGGSTLPPNHYSKVGREKIFSIH